ncbi:MAG: hypothetical protein QF733_03715 [Phycisphaerales bacterium]|jgi:hypothetical protein|nr:hypothetical protein [Phycisphaerales bacterium]
MSLMHRTIIAAFAVALTAVAAAAAPFGGAKVPDGVLNMLPDGAYVLAYTDSLQDFQKDLVTTVSDVEPQMAMMVAMAGPAAQLNMLIRKSSAGPGSAGVVLDGPVALFQAAPATPDGDPIAGAVFEVADTTDLVVSRPGMFLVMSPGSKWVALANADFTPAGRTTSISNGMLDASLGVNVDQAKLVEVFGPQINTLLATMQQPLPEGSVPSEQAQAVERAQAANAAKLRMFLDMIASWNIGLDLHGAEIDVLLRSTQTAGTPMVMPAGGLDGLTRSIPADMPIRGVFDVSAVAMLMSMSQSDIEAMPPATRASLEKLQPVWDEAVASMKSGVSFGMSFGDKGIEMVSVMDTSDPDGVLNMVKRAWTALGEADLGINVKPIRILAGTGVGYVVTIDAKRMMDTMGLGAMMPPASAGQPGSLEMMQGLCDSLTGPDGLPVRYFLQGDSVLSVIGNGRLGEARRLWSSGGADNDLTTLLGESLAPATWAMTMDVRRIADEGLAMARTMLGPLAAMLPTAVPDGNPVVMTMVGGSNGKTWDQVRVRTNLKDWYAMVQQMQTLAAQQAAASAPTAPAAGP